MNDLNNRSALVTGASRGIGAEIAIALADYAGVKSASTVSPQTDSDSWDYDQLMAKKTGISDSYLWATTLVLLVLGAWMYLKK